MIFKTLQEIDQDETSARFFQIFFTLLQPNHHRSGNFSVLNFCSFFSPPVEAAKFS